jgi:hypothetical protein
VRVSEYPALTVRLPRATKDQLASLSAIRRVPVWQLIDELVRTHLDQLPETERRLVRQFAARMAG